MKCGVSVGYYNYEPPESLHIPITRFQLTLKLNQMAFKKYSLRTGEFGSIWRQQPPILPRKLRESWYWHPLPRKAPCVLDIPSGFVNCWWHRNWLFTCWSWGVQISLHIGCFPCIIAGLIPAWDEGEINLADRLRLFAYWTHKLNTLSLELPSFSFPCSSKVVWWHCSIIIQKVHQRVEDLGKWASLP